MVEYDVFFHDYVIWLCLKLWVDVTDDLYAVANLSVLVVKHEELV
jgi:hypothetical protein